MLFRSSLCLVCSIANGCTIFRYPESPALTHRETMVETTSTQEGDSSLLPVQDGDLTRRWKWAFVWQTSLTEDHRCGRRNCRPALSMREVGQTGAESERLPRILALATKLTFVEMKAFRGPLGVESSATEHFQPKPTFELALSISLARTRIIFDTP